MKELKPKYTITRDENHAYTVSNNDKTTTLPGVTSILDIVGSKDKTNRLMGWAKKQALLKVAEHLRAFITAPVTIDETWIEAVRKSAWKRDKELLKEAGDLGTRVHNAIDSFITGQPPLLDPDTKQGYDNFMKWLEDSKIKLIKGDTYIASIKMGYGGAMDALGVRDGKLVLLDWKTSNQLVDTYSLQTAAYVMAFEETFEQDIDKAFVVRFGKEIPGDIEYREVDLCNATKAFKCAINLKNDMAYPLWMAAEGEQ